MVENLAVTAEVLAAIVRVLGPAGTAGTGFVVDRDRRLVVTCAHVVEFADVPPGGEIGLIHHDSGQELTAEVLEGYWRREEDVALLRVHGDLPPEATEVVFGDKTSPVGHEFWTFGFPPAKPVGGLVGTGTVKARGRDEQGYETFQLGEATEIVPGFSGGPLLDLATRRVAGMVVAITKGDHGRLMQTAFAIPAATLLWIDPGLKASDVKPYKALDVFEKEDAWLYFGRSGAVKRIVAELRRSQRFLAVLGPSGSGKSSLVRAGVIPAVQDQAGGSDGWGIVVTRPADLQAGMADVTLSGGPDGVRRWLKERPGVARLLLVIDQFEEAFVDLNDDRRAGLLASISDVVASTAPATVVVTMRDEFFSQLVQQAPSLTGALQDWLHLVPPTLTGRDLAEMVAEPARLVGVGFDDGLVERIVNDAVAAAPGVEAGTAASTVLPLLEFTLAQLWEKREDGVMTHSRYEAVGKVTGGIATWAEDALDRMGEADLPRVRTVFSGLVHLGDDRQGIPDSRWRRPLSSLARQPGEVAQVTEVVRRLADERLVVTSYDRDGGIELVELIHDALVREWDRLRRWLDEDRRFLTWQQELERQRQRWQEDSAEGGVRDTGKLLRGRDLDTALHFQHESDARLTDEQRAFIAESKAAREAEQRRQREQQRRYQRLRRYAAAGLVCLTVLALVAAVYAFAQQRKAVRERNDALAAQLDTEASGVFSGATGDSDIRALADTLAAQRIRSDPAASRGAFYTATTALNTTRVIIPTPAALYSMAFSPDGHTLASGSDDGNIRLWNLTDPAHPGPLGQPLTGHAGPVNSVAFSPDGHTLASGSDDHTIRLWNLIDPAHPGPLGQPLTGHAGPVYSVAFSPDGHTLASGSDDHTIRLWNLIDPPHPGPLGQPLTGHTDIVTSVAFSPDGHTLASCSNDFTIRLWNLTDPGHLGPLGQPLEARNGNGNVLAVGVNIVAFSLDGHTLASADADGNIRLWNLVDPAHPGPLGQPLTGHTGPVNSVAFSPDGHTLASGSFDNAVRLWNLTDPAHPGPLGVALRGHTGSVASVAFSPDGHTLASGSLDVTVRLWNLDTALPLLGHTGPVDSVAFSPDGQTLASGSDDGNIRLWNLTDPSHAAPLGQPLTGHTANSVAFSPDGHTLASGSDDGNIRLWNLTDPAHPAPLGQPLTSHTDIVQSVAFSPDGHTLASGGADLTSADVDGNVRYGNIRLWNLTDPAHPTPSGQPLTGHTGNRLGIVDSVAFSPDGHTLASGSFDNTVRLWDLIDPAHPGPLGQPLQVRGGVSSVAFSPDGHTLACGSLDHTVRLWDLTDPAHPAPLGQPLTGHANTVRSVAFSPDGHTLASGSDDHTVRLWDLTDLAHPAPFGQPLAAHTDTVTSVAFSPDGHTLASGSMDATLRLWPTRLDATVAALCSKLTSNISHQQWHDWTASTIDYITLCPNLPVPEN